MGKEGLLHISEISWERLDTMDGVFEDNEEVKVKLIELDERSGKLRLSRKVLLEKPEGYVERPPRERRDNNRGRDNRNRGRNDRRGNNRGRDNRNRDNRGRGDRANAEGGSED